MNAATLPLELGRVIIFAPVPQPTAHKPRKTTRDLDLLGNDGTVPVLFLCPSMRVASARLAACSYYAPPPRRSPRHPRRGYMPRRRPTACSTLRTYMRLRSLHHPLLGTVSWVALFLLLALLSACGAKQQRSELGYQLPEIEEDGLEFPHLRYTEDGRVIVDQPDAALQKAAFYTLHPLHWDDSLGPEPTIGTGYLHHAAKQTFAIMVASVPNLDFESTRVRAASELQALTEHKALARVTGLTYEADAPETPIQVRIDLGSATGVTNGDWFYILTGDKLDL